MDKKTFHIFRGDRISGELAEFTTEVKEGMVVLDAMHRIQAENNADISVRWNCKAGKCGSCAADINGKPRLMCKTHIDSLPEDKPITVRPLKSFPVIKDLVTDVSWNYKVNRMITPFEAGSRLEMKQYEVETAQHLRKCIECFICQSACHILRDEAKKETYFGPRAFVKLGALVKHPADTADRVEMLKEKAGIGLCNVTRCCTELCPEKIRITDDAIIPLKEIVIDRYYDPVKMFIRFVRKVLTR